MVFLFICYLIINDVILCIIIKNYTFTVVNVPVLEHVSDNIYFKL